MLNSLNSSKRNKKFTLKGLRKKHINLPTSLMKNLSKSNSNTEQNSMKKWESSKAKLSNKANNKNFLKARFHKNMNKKLER